jgi:4-diphosphocytidyl-2-C-methyl-D-erythritol kinase
MDERIPVSGPLRAGEEAARLVEAAPAKVNLTLHIVGRRADGYHELESLVAFTRLADRLTLRPGASLELRVSGPTAAQAGATDDNLVLRVARAAAERIGNLVLGSFALVKRLPAGAGLGGGSSDAAAALRLLARANGLALDDPRLHDVAKATGADIPVCLDPQPRLMRGIGEILSAPLTLPPLHAVLVHPGFPLATRDVFAALRLAPGERREGRSLPLPVPAEREGLLALLAERGNDLEAPALTLAPEIAEVLAALRALPGCRLARMSGSGSACFGLFTTARAAQAGARSLSVAHPHWWAQPTSLLP